MVKWGREGKWLRGWSTSTVQRWGEEMALSWSDRVTDFFKATPCPSGNVSGLYSSNSRFYSVSVLKTPFSCVVGAMEGSSTVEFVLTHKTDALTITWRRTCTFPAWSPWFSTTARTHCAAKILSCVSPMLYHNPAHISMKGLSHEENRILIVRVAFLLHLFMGA